MKPAGAVLALALLAAACGGGSTAATTTSAPSTSTTSTQAPTTTTTTEPPTTTTTTLDPAQQEFEADVRLIQLHYEGLNEASSAGTAALFQRIVDHAHPDLGVTAQQFDCGLDYLGEGYRLEILVDTASIIRTDDYTVPDNEGYPSGAGTVPRGRIYTLEADVTETAAGGEAGSGRVSFIIAVVGDGDAAVAYDIPFIPCS